MDNNQDVFVIRKGNRRMTVHAPSMAPLLFELLEPSSWARGLVELLSLPDPPDDLYFCSLAIALRGNLASE